MPISVLETTRILRNQRRDLSDKMIAISIEGTRALCLDLGKATEKDVPIVEVDLTRKEFTEPMKMDQKTFSEWLDFHRNQSKKFRIAWNRVRTRQKEAEKTERRGITQWKTVVSKVSDYIIALGAFRYNFKESCLEVDEFYTYDQPLIKEGEAVKVLAAEMFTRARNYSGCLDIMFTRDARDDKDGKIPQEFERVRERRSLKSIPDELIVLAEKHGVKLDRESGRISHKQGVEIYFGLVDLPREVTEKIIELEEAGYLKREVIAQAILSGIWSKEEVIWLLLNAPRPEGVLLGTDLQENRLFFSESFNYGRSALLATRFQQAVMADITGGVSIEDIEKVKAKCILEPKEKFWILRCNQDFRIPPSWTIDKSEISVRKGELILLLSRPRFSADPEYDKNWIRDQVDLLLDSDIEADVRCLLLSNEMVNTLILNIIYRFQDPKRILAEIREIVDEASEKGVKILFAPTRMYLLLDEEIEKRIKRVRNFQQFPSRKGPLKLWVIEVPEKEWDKPSGLRNASKDAKTFARLIVKKVDVNRYRKDFAFNCEVVEREAFQKFKVIAKFEGENSEDLINALTRKDKDYKGVIFSYVRPEDMEDFLESIENRKLLSILRQIQGGIVVINPPWESIPAPIFKVPKIGEPFEIPEELKTKIDAEIEDKEKARKYLGVPEEIRKTHQRLREALRNGTPLSMPSVRSHVFVQSVRDYIYYITETETRERKGLIFTRTEEYEKKIPDKPIGLRIAYGDGTEEKPFPLFSLKEIERPEGNFYYFPVSLVSLRHMEVDYFTKMSLIRNVEIQRKENSANQEEFAFRKVYSKIDQLLRILGKEIEEEDLDPAFKALLLEDPEIEEKQWDGLQLDIYLSTGLRPAAVGAFRAVIELLKKYRGQLIVTPRIIDRKQREAIIKKEGVKGVKENYYRKAEEWY